MGHSVFKFGIVCCLITCCRLAGTMERDFETNPPKVVIVNYSLPKTAFELLSEKCTVIEADGNDKQDILKKIKGVDGILWATHIPLDKEVLDAAGPQMKAVATCSAGYNHIDVEEFKKRGIKLGNTPEVLNSAVADTAILLTLAVARRLREGRLAIENNQWVTNDYQWLLGSDIEGSTVGIIGLGGIGQTIVKRMSGFEVGKFIYSSYREKEEAKELGVKYVTLDKLAKDSDFIIVACALNNQTHHLLNADFFSKMKKTASVVNISRGPVIDQDALVQALKEGKIFGAGLDVMTPEPLPSNHELLKFKNVVLSPHIGSATKDTRDQMALLAAQNLLQGIGGGEMFTPVV